MSALLALLLLAAGCVTAGTYDHGYTRVDVKEKGFTKHFRESQFAITDDGRYSVELLLADAQPLRVGENSLHLVVHNSHDEDVPGALLTVVYGEEGSSKKETLHVEDRGAGLYTVRQLAIVRPGPGELAVTIRQGSYKGSVHLSLVAGP